LQAELNLSFSDVSLASYNLDDDTIEKAINPSHSAILPVHLYGLPSPMDAVLDIAKRHKLKVLEDAAQALGARYKGKAVGALGDAGCFSFNAMKTVTTGEGGMVTTNDAKVADFVRAARDWGQRKRYEFSLLGANMRMTEIQAAMGIAQLGKLTASIDQRTQNAAAYNQAFASIRGLVLPMAPPGLSHAWYQYTLRVLAGKRDALRAHLDAKGVETGVYYPQGLHEIALFAHAQRPKLGRCEMASREALSLPVHPWVGAKERARIVDAVRAFHESA